MSRNKINNITPHPELSRSGLDIVTDIVKGYQLFQKSIPIFFHSGTQFNNLGFPVFR